MKFDILGGGPLDLAVITDDDGLVVAAGFRDLEWVANLAPELAELEPGELGAVAQHWRDYLAGDVNALERVAIRQAGSPVQSEVWAALRRVPPGHPVSYGEMAEQIGRPRAARAVGSACGSNRIAPFVPCHRVIAADGGLGGYGYGLEVKRWLLDHERAVVPQPA